MIRAQRRFALQNPDLYGAIVYFARGVFDGGRGGEETGRASDAGSFWIRGFGREFGVCGEGGDASAAGDGADARGLMGRSGLLFSQMDLGKT